MPRIGVDKQTGIQVAMKSWWITGTLFGSKGIGLMWGVEKQPKGSGISVRGLRTENYELKTV
jgi:hypothetical protein